MSATPERAPRSRDAQLYERARIIDALALAASIEAQLSDEKGMPIAQVPAEVICGWHD